MKITFLGSGSAFTMDNYQSNILIENTGTLLFDCGGDIRWSLKEVGKTLLDIDAVYISHLHADHTGGLEALGFMKYFVQKVKPRLYGNLLILDKLWSSSLSGGMDCIQMKECNLSTFFEVMPVEEHTFFAGGGLIKNSFDYNGQAFKLVQSIHVVADTMIKKSYGLMFDTKCFTEPNQEDNKKIFITSDTQYAPSQLRDFIKASDVVFHDCETVPYEYASGVHAHYKELKLLPSDLKRKIWLYHWNGKYEDLPNAEADGFAGFVKKGQVFEY